MIKESMEKSAYRIYISRSMSVYAPKDDKSKIESLRFSADNIWLESYLI